MSNANDGIDLYWLARSLGALAARLNAEDAARVSAAPAAVLVQAMSKTNPSSRPG